METYEHLVSYLMAKPAVGGGGVRRAFLPFHGRNQVLYSVLTEEEGKEEGDGGGGGESGGP